MTMQTVWILRGATSAYVELDTLELEATAQVLFKLHYIRVLSYNLSIGEQILMNAQFSYHIVWSMLTALTLMAVTCVHVMLAMVEMDSMLVTVRQNVQIEVIL